MKLVEHFSGAIQRRPKSRRSGSDLETAPTPEVTIAIARLSRKTVPALPPPIGPVSVGGAPLGPGPASGKGA